MKEQMFPLPTSSSTLEEENYLETLPNSKPTTKSLKNSVYFLSILKKEIQPILVFIGLLLLSFISWLGIFSLLTYLPQYLLLYAAYRIQRIFYTDERYQAGPLYEIEKQISSIATRVIFTHSKRTSEQICLKGWRPWKDELYDTQDVMTCNRYLLEGLEFNRKLAGAIYLGIAEVKESKHDTVQCGPLIIFPQLEQLKPVPYALVMIRLKESWSLDYQLRGGLGIREGMAFLAREVAAIHRVLECSPAGMGTAQEIRKKLEVNESLFQRVLSQLSTDHVHYGRYQEIVPLLKAFIHKYENRFNERYHTGHIKRCHGDLKVANLWVRPQLLLAKRKLLGLDCVDFRPDFCHIDTLSDVAMLAIDLEMSLIYCRGDGIIDELCGRKMADHFVSTYLSKCHDNTPEARVVLAYYLTEKAIVFACISILYDNNLSLGENYLKVALAHAERLKSHVQVPTPSFVENVLAAY
jgi:aminoglycoside phosphotransferase family enzyme